MLRILTGAALLLAVVAGAIAADDKKPTIEEIMKKVNGQKTGLHKKVGTELKGATPNWDDMQKQMKDYTKLCDGLGKNDPPKGDKKNWEKTLQILRGKRQETARSRGQEGQRRRSQGPSSLEQVLQGVPRRSPGITTRSRPPRPSNNNDGLGGVGNYYVG